jgi:hypothetical protein
VTVRLVPVDPAAAELRVDLHVPRTVHGAAVSDSGSLDPSENRVEILLRDIAEVIDQELLVS